jgi:hypothetical protein
MTTDGLGDSRPVREDQHAAGIQEQRFQAIHDSLYVGLDVTGSPGHGVPRREVYGDSR